MGKCLFSRVCAILRKLGLLNRSEEYVHSIGLIIGGLQTQPIHHDVSKSVCKENDYDRVMALPYAPASILLGLGHSVRLAVREKDVALFDKGGITEKCCIAGGVPGQQFEVVGRSTHWNKDNQQKRKRKIVTIESKHGLVFKGNFQHGGSPIPTNTAGVESETWTTVMQRLMPFIHYKKLTEADHKDILDILFGEPNLNVISRLHCEVLPLSKELNMDSNTVGTDWTPDEEGEEEEDENEAIKTDDVEGNDEDGDDDDEEDGEEDNEEEYVDSDA